MTEKKNAFYTPYSEAIVAKQKLARERVAHRKAAYDMAIKSGMSRTQAEAHATEAARKYAKTRAPEVAKHQQISEHETRKREAAAHEKSRHHTATTAAKAQAKQGEDEPLGPLIRGKKGGAYRIGKSGRRVYVKKR